MEYDEAVDARMDALPRLQQHAGAAYTFHQIATKALHRTAGVPNFVDWPQVHRDVFAKAVGQDKQPAAAVLEAIRKHSPGAVTPKQIAAVNLLGESKKMDANMTGNKLSKLSDLSLVDRETLELRGAMGSFKPENPDEIALCNKALTDGATRIIEWWFIEDYPKAIEFRETFARCNVELPTERPRDCFP